MTYTEYVSAIAMHAIHSLRLTEYITFHLALSESDNDEAIFFCYLPKENERQAYYKACIALRCFKIYGRGYGGNYATFSFFISDREKKELNQTNENKK